MTTRKRTVAEAAVEAFGDDVKTIDGKEVDTSTGEILPKDAPFGSDAFINLKGKLYLPARRRVQWFRGRDVVAHPDWTIDTEIVEHERGKRINQARVEGGYALVRAKVYDEYGRLISTGIKSEYSENFADYIEKAETGAIARALAIAGYGTESAMDLDEGIDGDRIADAPVEVKASAITTTGKGGKSATTTETQVKELSRLAARHNLDRAGILSVVAAIFPDMDIPYIDGLEEAEASLALRRFFTEMKPDDLGIVIATLSADS